MAGLLAPREASNLPGPRSGLRRGAPRLQVGRGGPWGGALIEMWRKFHPAGAVPGARASVLGGVRMLVCGARV